MQGETILLLSVSIQQQPSSLALASLIALRQVGVHASFPSPQLPLFAHLWISGEFGEVETSTIGSIFKDTYCSL